MQTEQGCSSHFSTQIKRSADVLVQCAIFPRVEFEVSIHADIAKIKRVVNARFWSPDNQQTSKRGVIKAFSTKSRKRLLETLACVPNADGGHFGTLTYPGRFSWMPHEVKRHIDTLSKAFARRFPKAGVFWRMELKPRLSGESQGLIVPHFHLLIFGANPPSLAYMRRWLNVVWSRIVAYPDSPPRKVRTQCEIINSRRHAANYASKYAAKPVETLQNSNVENNDAWGRHWGVFGALDLSAVMSVKLDQNQLIRFKRLVRSWLKSRGSAYAKRLARIQEDYGFSAFGLGDLSPGGGYDLFESTIIRMLLAAQTDLR